MEAISDSEFFRWLRTHTLAGFLCTEERGGNRDQIGWRLIGFEDKFAFQPTFGYYDAEAHSARSDKV